MGWLVTIVTVIGRLEHNRSTSVIPDKSHKAARRRGSEPRGRGPTVAIAWYSRDWACSLPAYRAAYRGYHWEAQGQALLEIDDGKDAGLGNNRWRTQRSGCRKLFDASA